MSTETPTDRPLARDRAAESGIRPRRAGFVRDVCTIALRALRQVVREPEAVVPSLVIPLFFFAVFTGSLQDIADFGLVDDIEAFQLPVAIVFAVTGVSRASSLVTDIAGGYFDRLLLTPISRPALLLGLMTADFAVVVALSVPVLVLGLAIGVEFSTGILGILLFVLLAGLWGVAFTGLPYALALKTGNPAVVNASFLIFFPFAFLTTTFVPQEALSGWLATIATVNPVTYILDALRSLISDGWQTGPLLTGIAAIALLGAVSQTLALLALRGRVNRS